MDILGNIIQDFDCLNNRSFLIMDPDYSNTVLMTSILMLVTDEIYTAENSIEAMDIIENGNIDFVITELDVVDNGMNDMLRDIRNVNLETKIIIVSAYKEFEINKETRNFVDAFVQKPYEIEKLLATLKNVLSTHNIK